MRNIMAGFAVLGSLAIGTVAATAHPLAVPPVGPSVAVHQSDWDGGECGPRCQEHRREAREQEHRRWEHQRWEESHRYPPAYDHSPR
jgi:hypothetical protein